MSILIKGFEMPKSCIECPMQFGGMCYVQPAEIDEPRVADTTSDVKGRTDWCPLIEVPSHEFARCTCEDSVQENGITLISEWATKGIDLAGEYGKTLDDLIVFLKVSYGMKMLFDLIGKQPKDGE